MVDIESHAGPENQVNIFTFFFFCQLTAALMKKWIYVRIYQRKICRTKITIINENAFRSEGTLMH